MVAKRLLLASSLTTCMENSQILPTFFNVTFNANDRLVHYLIDLTTELNTYVYAVVDVYAYGFLIMDPITVDLCKIGWKQFCPIFPGSLQVDLVVYLDKKWTDKVPGIAYTVPDIDVIVKIEVFDLNTNEKLSCIQLSFTNGKTVAQTGAKWATAVVAGLGLIVAALMLTFGNSNAASHVAANAVALFLYFQLVVIVAMQLVERVPPIAAAWLENLAWLMGFIRIQFMQDIFRWYVQATGGTPTTYMIHTTKQVLVERAQTHLSNLAMYGKRMLGLESNLHQLDLTPAIVNRDLDYALKSNRNLVVLRGIERMGFKLGIEPTLIAVTGFTWFVLIAYVLVGILLVCKLFSIILKKKNKKPTKHFYAIRIQFAQILKGLILRYIYIGFSQLMILSLWEFTVHDSAAVIVLAVIFLVVPLAVILYLYIRVFQYARRSIREYNNPAAILYGDLRVLDKFGFCYTMFHADKYWFGMIVIIYNFVRALFIGLCQSSGKASSLVLWIMDMIFMAILFWQKPYLNKPTNIINYCIAIVCTINSFLFTFFSGVYGQPARVSLVMAWVFFILNAAFSLILLLMILVFTVLAVVSKNPDARFAPAKDDRFSFQRRGKNTAQVMEKLLDLLDLNDTEDNTELSALGMAAQDHQANWELEMYHMQDQKPQEIYTPTIPQDSKFSDDNLLDLKQDYQLSLEENLSLKIKSIGRKFSRKHPRHKTTRMSDTLLDELRDGLAPEMGAPKNKHHLRHDLMMLLNISVNNTPTQGQGFL